MDDNEPAPKYKDILSGITCLSLGISIIVALLLGVGIGIFLNSIFNVSWLLWLGVFWGVCAAILNIYKVYKSQLKEFDELSSSKKYSK